MIRRAAAQLRAAWPFDTSDIVGFAAIVGLAVGLAGVFNQYVALTVVSALVLVVVFLIALRTPTGN